MRSTSGRRDSTLMVTAMGVSTVRDWNRASRASTSIPALLHVDLVQPVPSTSPATPSITNHGPQSRFRDVWIPTY